MNIAGLIGGKFGDKIAVMTGQFQVDDFSDRKKGVVALGGFESKLVLVEDVVEEIFGGGFAKRAGDGNSD